MRLLPRRQPVANCNRLKVTKPTQSHCHHETDLAIFEGHEIRRLYDEQTETWWFSVVDIIQVLTQQPDYQAARKYWNKSERAA